VENLWEKIASVEKNDKIISSPLFPQANKSFACGKVENFV